MLLSTGVGRSHDPSRGDALPIEPAVKPRETNHGIIDVQARACDESLAELTHRLLLLVSPVGALGGGLRSVSDRDPRFGDSPCSERSGRECSGMTSYGPLGRCRHDD